jgi:multidrug efflux pump subunit AcrA (membrane-fusion protein)
MKFALVLFLLVVTGCTGPYSRPPVAANDEKPVAVKTNRVTLEPIPEIVIATGELLAEEQATIGVKAPGRLIKLHVDLGSQVQANQILAEIDPTDYRFRVQQAEALLNQTRAKLGISSTSSDEVVPEQTAIVREAEAVVKEARFISETTQKLTSEGVLSRIDAEKAQVRRQGAEAAYQAAREQVMQLRAELNERKAQLDLARQNLSDCVVRAPFSGAVTRRQASPGEYLPVNAPIATLVRQHPLRIRTEIPERLAPRIRVGQPIAVKMQGQEIERTGRVVRLSPAIEAQSRSLVVEGEMPNENGKLRPGSFVEVSITVDPNARGIAVRKDSIVSFAGADRVYIANNGVLDDRLIKTGRTLAEDKVEIVSGLDPGLDVVLKPDGRLAKGKKVTVQ